MSIHEFGPFRLDVAERLLLRAGQPVSLTPKAFDLLVLLVERPGRLVTKQELMTAVWPDTFVEEANLTYTVSALRKALGDGQDGEQYIQTVPTRGYRFVAPVIRGGQPPAVSTVVGRTPLAPRGVLVGIAIFALAAALLAALPSVVTHLRERRETRPPTKLTIEIPDSAIGMSTVPVAQISPDGRRVAFIAGVSSNGRGLWIRSMDAAQANLVKGTEDAQTLFWAPDSRRLAFATTTALKKVTIADGTIETLCDPCAPGRGGTWGRNDSIVLASQEGDLLQVPAAGGPPKTVAQRKSAEGEVALVSPYFLPDGERFLYSIRHVDSSRNGVFVGQLGSADRRLLLRGDYTAIYAAQGYLLLERADSITAQSFDPRRLELSGEPVSLIGPSEYWPTPAPRSDPVAVNVFRGLPNFSVSNTGILAYAIGELPESQFQWFGRGGEPLELVGKPGAYFTFDLSRDDSRLVFARIAGDNASLWVHDFRRGIDSRLTFGPSSYFDPRWGPNGEWIVANRPRLSPASIVRIQPDGAESAVSTPAACVLDDLSSDGGYVTCRIHGRQLLAAAMRDAAKPVVVRTAPAGFIDQSKFSPDGRWIAFNANESGQFEVYVTRFPASQERWQVSQGGGVQPVWGQDGRELYYLGLDGALNVVDVRPGDRQPFSAPKRLFNTGLVAPTPAVEQYAVSADGRRVLILKPVDTMVHNSIGVILDWPSLLPSRSR